MSFSQLESLLGAALGNGGIEELMAGAGLNGKINTHNIFIYKS